MSVRELKRAEVLGRVKAGDLTLRGASVVMGLSYRQAKRLWKRFRRKGAVALRHRSVGRRSPRRKPAVFRRTVLAVVRREFGGDATHDRFGPTLAAEHLHDEYRLDVHHETLRRWMLAAGLWSRARQASASRPCPVVRPSAAPARPASDHPWRRSYREMPDRRAPGEWIPGLVTAVPPGG